MLTRQQVIDALHEGIVTVEFTKLDGTMRLMDCTLNPTVIPKTQDVKANTPEAAKRKSPDSSVAVWDMEKHGWRSFRWDSLAFVNGQQVEKVEDGASQ